jgi:parvulin-like peptidyl-prolyl isomerase
MMRAMRENAKWIFYILAIAFVGWMVFDVGMGLTGQGQYGASDVVIKVDGMQIRAQEYQVAVSNAYEAHRQQSGSAPLTREDERSLQDQVVEDLIRDRLLGREYRRLGIRVTDREIIEAARTSPLPELLQHPDLQTDGQFDPEKYQRLLSSAADPQLLQYVEARYRDQIPQFKLAQYLTADVYVSDAKLWRIWRDRNDSVTAAVVAFRPEGVPDDLVPVTDQELERYYDAHQEDFKRPAVAFLSFVAQPRYPDAADTAAAVERAERIRAAVARASADSFSAVARRESADTVAGAEGGDLGWFPKAAPPFVREFSDAVARLRPGQVSELVRTQFGLHIIRLTAAAGDSLRASHILVPIELAGAHLDAVEARADSLDRIAAEQADGAALDSAARLLDLPLAPARMVEGERLQLGRFLISDVGVWAFEAVPGETSPVIEATPAFYVFRLDSLTPEGTPPLAGVRDAVAAAARLEKKREIARTRAAEAVAQLRTEPSLAAGAAARGWQVSTATLTRIPGPGPLQDELVATGAAFGLRVGERSGVIEGRHGYFVIESLARRGADSTAWAAQRDAQRQSLVEAARQARVRVYLDDLRARATVVDRREELARAAAQAPPTP